MSRRWLIAVSVSAHVAVGVAVFVSGVWRIERLHADPLHGSISVPLQPPAPAGGQVAAVETKFEHKRHKEPPKVPVQPTITPVDNPPASDTTDHPPGTGTGSGTSTDIGTCLENCAPAPAATPVCGDGSVDVTEACDDGNTTGGDGCSATCQVEPRPQVVQAARPVAPTVLQGLRISGETQLHPDTVTQNQMIREGTTSVRGLVNVCISTGGGVSSASTRVSTKYESYDATLLAAVRTWRYRPYLLNDAPVPACSTVTFLYTIK
jgi:TonB family protein